MKTKLLCFNEDFSFLPKACLGRQLPKSGEVLTIKDQIVSDSELFVELEEIPSLLFSFAAHFVLLSCEQNLN